MLELSSAPLDDQASTGRNVSSSSEVNIEGRGAGPLNQGTASYLLVLSHNSK